MRAILLVLLLLLAGCFQEETYPPGPTGQYDPDAVETHITASNLVAVGGTAGNYMFNIHFDSGLEYNGRQPIQPLNYLIYKDGMPYQSFTVNTEIAHFSIPQDDFIEHEYYVRSYGGGSNYGDNFVPGGVDWLGAPSNTIRVKRAIRNGSYAWDIYINWDEMILNGKIEGNIYLADLDCTMVEGIAVTAIPAYIDCPTEMMDYTDDEGNFSIPIYRGLPYNVVGKANLYWKPENGRADWARFFYSGNEYIYDTLYKGVACKCCFFMGVIPGVSDTTVWNTLVMYPDIE